MKLEIILKSREIWQSKIGPFSLACTDPYAHMGLRTNLGSDRLTQFLPPSNNTEHQHPTL